MVAESFKDAMERNIIEEISEIEDLLKPFLKTDIGRANASV